MRIPVDARDQPAGCGCGRVLPIVWQRLVTDGETCPRCGGTEVEVVRAVATLVEALRPLGIEPTLETRELDDAEFEAAPSESNRIFVAGRPLESWLDATAGSSPCCAVCGDSPCRTVEVDGTAFETVPARLIVKAGLLAAATLLDG